MASAGGRGASSSAAAAAAAAAAGEVGYKTDDDVRSYVRKRKRANKNCSVSHLRRALNIGYKKAKRIHDEVDDELRRERHDRRERGEDIGPRTPSRSHRGGGADDEDEDEDSDDGLDYDDPHDRREGSPHHDEDEHDDGDIPDEALREHIRKKLRRGEVIYVHHMRDLGLSYRRTRRILQEFIDQGKIQKLPRSSLSGRSVGTDGGRGASDEGLGVLPTAEDAVKMKPLKQKVKEENKKAAESQLKTEPGAEDHKKDDTDHHQQQESGDSALSNSQAASAASVLSTTTPTAADAPSLVSEPACSTSSSDAGQQGLHAPQPTSPSTPAAAAASAVQTRETDDAMLMDTDSGMAASSDAPAVDASSLHGGEPAAILTASSTGEEPKPAILFMEEPAPSSTLSPPLAPQAPTDAAGPST